MFIKMNIAAADFTREGNGKKKVKIMGTDLLMGKQACLKLAVSE